MKLEWKDNYRIGDEKVDRQHQCMFDLANAMYDAKDQAAMRLAAIRLYQHVREHFADEEALMRKVGFPGYAEHVESHNRMLAALNAVSQSIGRNDVKPDAVSALLMDWTLNHIPYADAQVASYIQGL